MLQFFFFQNGLNSWLALSYQRFYFFFRKLIIQTILAKAGRMINYRPRKSSVHVSKILEMISESIGWEIKGKIIKEIIIH